MEVRQCLIGYGLYATRKYIKGALLFDMSDGHMVKNPTRYSVEINPYTHVIHPFGSFLNHSSQHPSVIIAETKVLAARNIEEGDELTFNYNVNETHLACPFVASTGEAVRGSSFF